MSNLSASELADRIEARIKRIGEFLLIVLEWAVIVFLMFLTEQCCTGVK